MVEVAEAEVAEEVCKLVTRQHHPDLYRGNTVECFDPLVAADVYEYTLCSYYQCV